MSSSGPHCDADLAGDLFVLACAPGSAIVPWGGAAGLTLEQQRRDYPTGGAGATDWFRWAARRSPGYWPSAFSAALRLFLEQHPELVAEAPRADNRRRAA